MQTIQRRYAGDNPVPRTAVAFLLAASSAGFPLQAWAADIPVDGLYRGPVTVTHGAPEACGSTGKIGVRIKQATFQYRFRRVTFSPVIDSNGNFDQTETVMKGRGFVRDLNIKGKVSDGVIEADLTTTSRAYGLTCAYHWALRRQ